MTKKMEWLTLLLPPVGVVLPSRSGPGDLDLVGHLINLLRLPITLEFHNIVNNAIVKYIAYLLVYGALVPEPVWL